MPVANMRKIFWLLSFSAAMASLLVGAWILHAALFASPVKGLVLVDAYHFKEGYVELALIGLAIVGMIDLGWYLLRRF